jgi:hydroxypyruvate reductase
VIGSGPLMPGEPVALDLARLPGFLRDALTHAPAMPEAGADCFRRVTHEIVARLADAKAAAVARASALGLRTIDERMFVDGPAEAAGSRLAATLLESSANTLHVWGGEATVVLPSQPGRGGRCQQLALSAARGLAGQPAVWLLAAATDGSDGPGEIAGALVDGKTLARAAAAGFDASDCLARADAGSLLAASGDLLHTGPTGSNVMDVMLALRLDAAR